MSAHRRDSADTGVLDYGRPGPPALLAAWNRNSVVLIVGGVLFLIVFAALSALQPAALWHACSDGALLILWLIAAWGIGLPCVPRGLTLSRSLRLVIAIALGLGAISLV